ncbi:MAG: cupin domain-containing protein [Dehalococcoidia bacterium]
MNVNEVAAGLELWKPEVVGEANGFQMKVGRLHGEFPWHTHEAEDELFYCIEGSFRIEIEGAESMKLNIGDVVVVPAGTRHRPIAEEPALAVLFEKAETRQYGD